MGESETATVALTFDDLYTTAYADMVRLAYLMVDSNAVAEELVGRLAAGPTVMLALTKRLLSVSSESGRDRAFEQEAWAAEVVSQTADLQEGLRSFAERREAHFQGF